MTVFPKSSRARRSLALVVVLTFLIATLPGPASASLLRGRLIRIGPGAAQYPASGVTVTVFRQDIGRSVPSVTDANGMYYLNIPPGVYWLEVWVTNPPRIYQIQVVEPNTDIPPIAI